MKYHRTIFTLGFWVILVPFLGIPLLIKKILLVIAGALLVLLGVLLSQTYTKTAEGETGISYAEKDPGSEASQINSFEIE